MNGHLHLQCTADAHGQTVIRSQSFTAPMHLSKPYWDGATLIINPVNPTAGFFGGDTVDVRIEVASGASVALTSPSATRIHQARAHQADMRLEQRIMVARGGWLDWRPEPTIPQAGCRFIQSTEIHVESGAELFFMETLAPGRVASGECFAFDALSVSTQLWTDESLTAMERYRLTHGDESISALAKATPGGYFSSGFVVSERLKLDHTLCPAIGALTNAGARPGASLIEPGVCVLKLLAVDSLTHRRALNAVVARVYEALGRRPPTLRKL